METETETRQPTMMDEGVPGFRTFLHKSLSEEKAQRFLDLVKDTGSLIAGGSVLSAYRGNSGGHGFRESFSHDVDVYVPIKNINRFLDTLVRNRENRIIKSPRTQKSYKSSLYCTSFLKKNGIKKVYTFTTRDTSDSPRQLLTIDVMIVRNRRTPLQVVNNFDLTFCQIWHDGEHVYASHPEDVRNKKGTLQGEYVPLFVQGNVFLRKRIKKYIGRGYEITLDPAYAAAPIAIQDKCNRPDDTILMKMWSSRVLLNWFLKVRDSIERHRDNMPPSIRHDNILIVPLVTTTDRARITARNILGKEIRKSNEINSKDDGYDSEDYTENEPLYDLITPAEESSESKELLFHREANKLLEIVLWPNTYNWSFKSMGKLLQEGKDRKKMFPDDIERHVNFDRILHYHAELLRRCVRKGTSFITQEEDVNVYDLHEHPLEAGISAEDLEGYLSHHITDTDKSQVPCYYKPNPAHPEDPVNCTHMLSLSEVRYIVSDEFYKQYTAPPPVKLGLDQFMSHYDQTLHNAKEETPGWGMIYHHTVCPFCLQFESRDSGCAYMTHENRRHEPSSSAPFCDERLQNTELVRRYKALSDRGAASHLEFCAECGRACVDHHHVSAKAPYTLIDLPTKTFDNGRVENDYATCVGGGRAELFARILAIRKVYREGGITDSIEERRQAALAADNAPNDPELMAQGKAILDQEEASRHWTNAPLPTEKMYSDRAYKVDSNNSDSNNSSNNDTVMEGGKKRRKTYKRKRAGGTRKH